MDFGDESIRGGFRERPTKFKMEANRRYRLRIMTKPLAYYGSNVQGTDSGFYALSLADYETAKAAIDGDNAALARARQQCPLFERGLTVDRRWVVLIHLIGVEARGRMTRLNQILPWSFGRDKYSKLTEIYKTLRTTSGQQIPMSAIELNVLCNDANFQKADITPITNPSQMVCRYNDSLAACANELYEPNNPEAGSPLLDDFLEPDSREDLIRSLNRVTGQGALPAEEPAAGDLPEDGQFLDQFTNGSLPGDPAADGTFGDPQAELPPDTAADLGGDPAADLDSLLRG